MKSDPSRDPGALRHAAEARVRKRRATNPAAAVADRARLQHELEVHKTELEMQNEELVASQAELQAALDLYTDLYNLAPVGYLTLGPDGEILQINIAAATLLGDDRSHLVSRRLIQFVCLADRPAFEAFLRSVFAGQKPEICEVTLSPAAGPPPTVQIEATLNPSGLECRAVLTNITQRIQEEQALRNSEARRALTMKVAKAGTWEWEVVTGRNIWSEELWDMYGLVPHSCEPSYEAWWQTVHPDDREPIERALTEAVRQGAELNLEWRVRGAAGEDRWLAAHGGPLRDEADRVSRYVGIVVDVTPRKRGEEDLRQRLELQDQLSKVALTVPGMIYSFRLRPDGSTCMPYTTPAIEDVWGLRPEDVIEDFSPAMALVHPEDAILLRESITESARTISTWRDTFRIRHSRKGERWLEGHSIPRQEPDGGVLWHGFVHDVTNRRQIEESLRESESRYRLLADNAEDFVGLLDARENRLYISPSFYRLTGWTPEEVIGSAWHARLHPDDIALVKQTREANLAGRQTLIEHRIRCRDGSWMWVEAQCKPIPGPDGAVTQFLIWQHDITKRKQAEKELETALVKYRTLFELFPMGITIADKEGNIAEANRLAVKLLGLSPEDQRQRHISGEEWKIIGPDGTPMPAEDYASARALREHRLVENVEMGVIKPNSETVWLNVAAAPLEDYGVAITYGDITERRKIEAHLRQTQKLEGIGQLAGGVAHDFNNILTAIMVQLELLQLSPSLDQETREGLKEIDREVRRAADVTSQLLMFSRRSALAMKSLDLNEVVANLLKFLRRLIGETIELRFETKNALPAVKGDAGLIGQVMMNLAMNARDAMPGGGCITIATELHELGDAEAAGHPDRSPGRFVCLTVADTGCGMDAATLKRIFEPFFTTKEIGKGTGLGLATVHGIVAQHRGWVEVESAPGAGTTFRVYLPVEAQLTPGNEKPPEEAPLPRGTETILMVEDDDNLRRIASRSLRALGYQVLEAANGPDALAAWQAHGERVDLLFTDMVIPEKMNGLQLSQVLRDLQPTLKVIATSGYSEEIAKAGQPQNRDIKFLPKPFSTRILASIVRERLDQRD